MCRNAIFCNIRIKRYDCSRATQGVNVEPQIPNLKSDLMYMQYFREYIEIHFTCAKTCLKDNLGLGQRAEHGQGRRAEHNQGRRAGDVLTRSPLPGDLGAPGRRSGHVARTKLCYLGYEVLFMFRRRSTTIIIVGHHP